MQDLNDAARSWDVEYESGRYRNEPPVPFVADIVAAARDHRLLGEEGVYIGCGNGRNYLPLVDAGLGLVGLDLSGAALAQLAERAPHRRERLIHGDLSALPDLSSYALVIAGSAARAHVARAAGAWPVVAVGGDLPEVEWAATMRIAIAVFEGAEELDFVGPWEVLAAWRFLYPDDVEVVLVGEDTEPVTCAKGMRVVAHTSWDEVGGVDVLVYPGGRGTRPHLGDERIRARLRDLRERGTLMTSVCTGALVFADAGLLDGQPATTYWSAFDELLPLGREIDPRPDDRFVDAGQVITAAGVSAGIDMALHLVGRLGSPEKAREVRRYIQYDPEPPY